MEWNMGLFSFDRTLFIINWVQVRDEVKKKKKKKQTLTAKLFDFTHGMIRSLPHVKSQISPGTATCPWKIWLELWP